MVKTLTVEPDTKQQKTDKQGRKKRARREAKMMLKIEQAKKDVQKAEKKVARTQANLEESRTRLRGLEQKLNEARASEQPQTQAIQELQTQSPEAQNAQNNGVSSQEQLPIASSTLQADGATTEEDDQSAQQVANPEVNSIFEADEVHEDISANEGTT